MRPPGNQKPTFAYGLVSETGYGKQAVEMAAAYGHALDPWQALIVKQLFSFSLFRLGLSTPRQNGKNAILEVFELYAPVVLGRKILHTAHEARTVDKHFKRLRTHFYENPKYPDLMACAEVRLGRGSEEIAFDNGGVITFSTRTASAGRGHSYDVIVLDESQEMDEDEWAALTPTLTASPDAMIIYTGTPPVSSRSGRGVIFQNYRKKAYEGTLQKGDVYVEWGITDITKTDVFDRRIWKRVNPAWEYRINERVLIADFDSMDKESFAREHLGYWYRGAKNTIYRDEHWAAGIAARRPAPDEVDRFAAGIVYAQDGESWAAAFGAVLKDGSQYTELIDLASTKKGTGGILQVIAAFDKMPGFVGALVYGKAGTLNLIGDAEACGLFKPALIEICRHGDKIASNALIDGLMSTGELKHPDQEPLKASLLSLDKYMVNSSGGGFSFISRTGQLIAAEAAALALYWAKNRRPKPKRKKSTVW